MTTPQNNTQLTYGLETIMTAESIRETLDKLAALPPDNESSGEFKALQSKMHAQLSMLFMWVEIDISPLSKTP